MTTPAPPRAGSPPVDPSTPRTPPAATSPPPGVARLTALLRQTVRLTSADGRVFLGTFVGTDRARNVLLASAQEFRVERERAGADGDEGEEVVGPPRGSFPVGRFVGQVMVPWRLVRKAEVEAPPGGGDPLGGGAGHYGGEPGYGAFSVGDWGSVYM